MSEAPMDFVGTWLHDGEWKGKDFAHSLPNYDHDESPGGNGSTAMRYAVVEGRSGSTAVWIPAHWTDEQVAEALDSNW